MTVKKGTRIVDEDSFTELVLLDEECSVSSPFVHENFLSVGVSIGQYNI